MARVLLVSPEAAPFARSGGLADVMEALPKALARSGQEVAVVLPCYRTVATSGMRMAYSHLTFALGAHRYSANLLEHDRNGVRHLFVQIPELYDRPHLYGDDTGDYSDNALRFGALCRAALEIARHVFRPDVIHAHEWQAALLPVLLRDTYRYHPAFGGIKSVLTIHNIGYQGVFAPNVLTELGLSSNLLRPEALEFWGNVNLLKGGIVFADALNTVSPAYAREIQTPGYGFGLENVLRQKTPGVFGILNGADYEVWNPADDPRLPGHFDSSDLAGKAVCKTALLQELGLSAGRNSKPAIGMVSRFATQKGIDLLMKIPHELAALDCTLVIHGSGEERFEDFFRWFAAAYADRVALRIGFDPALAHRIYAGSDVILVPSRYEPCGLSQLYGMRYGALPLVRATGGLDDTVDSETGFKFPGDRPQDLLNCIRSALRLWGTAAWNVMVNAAMSRDLSWDRSAAEYIRLYDREQPV